jgi:hypothetical protein
MFLVGVAIFTLASALVGISAAGDLVPHAEAG